MHIIYGVGHRFRSAAYDTAGIAGLDCLSRHLNGGKTAATDFIDRYSWRRCGHSGFYGNLARWILALAGLQHVAEYHVVDILKGYAGALYGFLEHSGA
ncbi:hypothetical protein SDC9_132913 [bioreactor metagenome]|uniref:Uncharacterized protein n=1 Tax=bioreactor metagenome TaxID=1076179 RepID=A0A645D982_9ZZZZ